MITTLKEKRFNSAQSCQKSTSSEYSLDPRLQAPLELKLIDPNLIFTLIALNTSLFSVYKPEAWVDFPLSFLFS